ncbi:hypothetical protein pRL70054 (plasmid) [Rhizobium johnstonii 3841]|uniref:Uncharacterized protein n=1 Tax=Rhizobium johnstonii (strain DSM 114642 / LMG 32736 / 3841) TaxID=216596 RepID=Q1M9W3_RHIJ3|nr:hypothetical protein pRL70054 [Rhizobium johnstonii 3841]
MTWNVQGPYKQSDPSILAALLETDRCIYAVGHGPATLSYVYLPLVEARNCVAAGSFSGATTAIVVTNLSPAAACPATHNQQLNCFIAVTDLLTMVSWGHASWAV